MLIRQTREFYMTVFTTKFYLQNNKEEGPISSARQYELPFKRVVHFFSPSRQYKF